MLEGTIPAKKDSLGAHIYLPPLKVYVVCVEYGKPGQSADWWRNALTSFPLPYYVLAYRTTASLISNQIRVSVRWSLKTTPDGIYLFYPYSVF